jgi:glycosyltransferase involved in cell wall biosynthesis
MSRFPDRPTSAKNQITPLIITYNEAPNIQRTLNKLLWAHRIVVVDSGSTDETVEILRSYPQVEVIPHPFTDFASQCNYGLTQITSTWVLSLDADYELSDDLVVQLGTFAPPQHAVGYRARFVYRIYGHPLRGSLYPPRTVLYRKNKAVYHQEGHGHRVILDGNILALNGIIYHDDRKPLARWLTSQRRYACIEAEYLLAHRGEKLKQADRLRLMGWPAPLAVFLYVLFVRRCLFEGWPGWFYTMQRTLAELMLALEIIDRRLRAKSPAQKDPGSA